MRFTFRAQFNLAGIVRRGADLSVMEYVPPYHVVPAMRLAACSAFSTGGTRANRT